MAQSKKKKKVVAKTKPKTKPKAKPIAKKLAKPVAKAKAKKMARPVKAKVKAPTPKKSSGSGKVKGLSNLNDILTPLDDRVVVMVETFTQTSGGLFIPASVTDRPSRGKVVAVGRGHRDKKGRVRPMDVRRGDEILFAPFSGTELKLMDQDLLILREAEILGIVD